MEATRRGALRGVIAAGAGALVLALPGAALASARDHLRTAARSAGSVTVRSWGTADNTPVNLYTLRNRHGMSVQITNYGGDVHEINVPDRDGRTTDVVLGFPTLADYVADFTQGARSTSWPLPGGSGDTYFGAVIGRYANRIANHAFTMKCTGCSNNGVTYTLDADNGQNTLHGGYLGWNTQVWKASPVLGAGYVGLKLTDTFPSGEGCVATLSPGCNGFPANVTATVVYHLTSGNALTIAYRVVNDSSTLATVVNVTNHSYFNLGGEASGSVYDQDVAIDSGSYQPVNTNQIPVGFASVAGTAYDFNRMHPIGQYLYDAAKSDQGGQGYPQLVIAHGYDNNWVLRGSGYRLAAEAFDPDTGITMKTYTDQPGVQFYTGNFLDGDLVGVSGHIYRQGAGFTLETQHYPDAPNHIGQAGWPTVVLNPSSTFTTSTAFDFGVAGRGWATHRGF